MAKSIIFTNTDLDSEVLSKLKVFFSYGSLGNDSFLSTHSRDNTNAPEDSIFGFFRHIFFKDPANKDISDLPNFNQSELDSLGDNIQLKSLIYTFKGRNVLQKNKDAPKRLPYFFTILYPHQAKVASVRHGGKSSAYYFMVHSILAQKWFRGKNNKKWEQAGIEKAKSDLGKIYEAFYGFYNIGKPKTENYDIFSDKDFEQIAYKDSNGNEHKDEMLSKEEFIAKEIKALENERQKGIYTYDIDYEDEFCNRVYEDFINLCDQEKNISKKSRFEWIQLMMGLISISTNSYSMGHAKLISKFKNLLVESIISERKFDDTDIENLLITRMENMLIGSTSPNNEFLNFFTSFQKDFMEIAEITYLLIDNKIGNVEKLPFNIKTIKSYLEDINENRDILLNNLKISRDDFQSYIQGKCTEYTKYIKEPLKGSLATTVYEYSRQIWKPSIDNLKNENYLIWYKNPNKFLSNRKKCHQIIPGPKTIRLFINLYKFHLNNAKSKRFTLKNLIEFFKVYGINFGKSEQGTRILKKQIQNLGLLDGSSDAGINIRIKYEDC